MTKSFVHLNVVAVVNALKINKKSLSNVFFVVEENDKNSILKQNVYVEEPEAS